MSRYRLAVWLRFVASAALLVVVVAFFYRPLTLVLGPTLQRAGLDSVLRGSSGAPGFVLQVVSKPSGAEVVVDGVLRGKTPALLNVVCRQGNEVSLVVRAEGHPEFNQSFSCREGVPARARVDLTE